jgi:two-component system, OmpR family, sensor histidine kinase KdpD
MPRPTFVWSARGVLTHTTGNLAAIAAVVEGLRLLGVENATTASLLLLLVVLGAATISGIWIATVTSVVAMLAFNYFFLPPVGTFTIADPQNWVALVVFLVVAGIASQLSSLAQTRARDAIERRREVSRLFDLSRDILLTTDIDAALPSLSRYIARRFEIAAVAIAVPSEHGWSVHQGGSVDVAPSDQQLNEAFARQRGVLEYDARSRTYGGHAEVVVAGGVHTTLVPLRLGTRTVGLLATQSGVLEPGTLDALGGVIAIAIERVHFLRERQTADALRQRADLASTLLASLSHDLRTPLTAVRLAVTNLQDPQVTDADRHAQAQLALGEIDRLNRVFQDILDMARIDASAIALEPDWVTPADVIDAALARVGRVLDDRTLRIDADAASVVEVDPRLTSSALAHLIENAVQYSQPQSPIDIHGETTSEGLHLTVRDHGPGLDPDEMAHLFERFFRGRVARQHALGTGMGLAITRGLLAAQGGRVWGENATGGGARFSIAVPGLVRPASAVSGVAS